MNRRNPSGALHAIAQTLKDVSCIDRDPDPDVLAKRIEIHRREIESAIHRHRLEFGFPDCRLSEILPKLCAAMGEELRELRPTTRFLNTSTGEGGRRPVVDRATRIAHLQAYGDWLAEIIERFAMRVDEADAFHAKPFEWFNDRRAGKYRSESPAIIESKAGIAGLRIAIEETPTQLEPGNTQAKPQMKPGKKGNEDLELLEKWEQFKRANPKSNQLDFAKRERIQVDKLRNKLGYARRLLESMEFDSELGIRDDS